MATSTILLAFLLAVFCSIVPAAAVYLDDRNIIEKMFEDRDGRQVVADNTFNEMPTADGKFHVYVLPVGQGDAQVLQCPNGDVAIVDLGTSESPNNGFWNATTIINFLQGHFDYIKNIIITHNHDDHYSLFSEVFPNQADLSNLTNIYISCTSAAMGGTLQNWINTIGASNKLREFNGGATCGSSNNSTCDGITICPGNTDIKPRVLSANAAGCTGTTKNIDSIVVEIKFKSFGVQLNGDFEDASRNQNGHQLKMVDFYGSDLKVTVYKLAHHGAECSANKQVMLDAVQPKAVFVSSNPWYNSNLRHLRCSITDYLWNNKTFLCKPRETNPSSPFYCGEHPIANINIDAKLQQAFSCGLSKGDPDCTGDKVRAETANEYAIYSTMPSADKINLVHLLTDGTKWGFVNNFRQKVTTPLMI